ncbi:uncharacterized protein [Vicugna pacos]|uniref:Uncharacterized protein n=1 Tax=Vicugna pacos TaxID=30538 RepID=A0ABM5E565_VICPA
MVPLEDLFKDACKSPSPTNTPRPTSTDPLSQPEHLRNSDRSSPSSKDKDAKNLGKRRGAQAQPPYSPALSTQAGAEAKPASAPEGLSSLKGQTETDLQPGADRILPAWFLRELAPQGQIRSWALARSRDEAAPRSSPSPPADRDQGGAPTRAERAAAQSSGATSGAGRGRAAPRLSGRNTAPDQGAGRGHDPPSCLASLQHLTAASGGAVTRPQQRRAASDPVLGGGGICLPIGAGNSTEEGANRGPMKTS